MVTSGPTRRIPRSDGFAPLGIDQAFADFGSLISSYQVLISFHEFSSLDSSLEMLELAAPVLIGVWTLC